jgi:hypothetical protein
MNGIQYFSIIKFITALISIPLLIANKNLVYILLALNISEATFFSFYKKHILNGILGLILIYWSLVLPKYQDVYVLLYVIWNIYFSNNVLDDNDDNTKHNGVLTSAAMNLIPLVLYVLITKDKLWHFSISRLVLILFYSLHLIDSRSCHS